MANPVDNEEAPQVYKAERTYLIVSVLLILAGVIGFVLLYFPFRIDAIPLVISNLFTAFFVSGVALITFEKISHDHQKRLLSELQSKHKSNVDSMVDVARYHLSEIEKASKKETLRSLISGGDKIWERLEKEIIQKPFYAEKKEIIYVFEKIETSDLVKVITYEKSIIRNNSPIAQNFPYHTFSEFNTVESEAGATFGYEYIVIDDKDYVGEVRKIKSEDGKVKEEFYKEIPIIGGSTSIMETKMTKSVIQRDFVRKQMTVGTEEVVIQIFKQPSVNVFIWSANNNGLENGIADSEYIQQTVRQHAEYKGLEHIKSSMNGLLKNESFIIEWY